MKYLILILSLSIIACNESQTSQSILMPINPPASCAPSNERRFITDLSTDNLDYFGLGTFLAQDGSNVWLTDGNNHYYSVNATTHELGGANEGLVFADENCTELIGEVFNYPLSLIGDIYVFQFEGQLYQYNIGDAAYLITVDQPYYFKSEGGLCNSCPGPVENVRSVTPFEGTL